MSLIDLLLEHKHEYLASNTIGKIIHEYFTGENTTYKSDEYLHVNIVKFSFTWGFYGRSYILGYIHNHNIMGVVDAYDRSDGDYKRVIKSYYYSQDYIEHIFDDINIKGMEYIWGHRSSLSIYPYRLTLNDMLPKHTKSARLFI